MFIEYCRNGNLKEAKDYFIQNPNIKISTDGCKAFRVACKYGNLDIVKWLYSIKSCVINKSCDFTKLLNDVIKYDEIDVLLYLKDIKKNCFLNEHFSNACKHGNFEIVKIIYSSTPNLDISHDFDEPFRLACEYGHINIASWLLDKNPSINVSAFTEHAFRKACENGHIGIAKWLIQEIKPNINIREWDDYALKYSCISGHIEIVKWLFSQYIVKELFDSYKEKLLLVNKLFKYACGNGHLELARWIYNGGTGVGKINISIDNNEPFTKAFSNGFIEMVDWLYTLAEDLGGNLPADLIAHAEECGKIVCPKGGIEVMRWLYKIKGYSYNHIDYFKLAITNGHYKLAKWLYSVNPDVKITDQDEEIFCICCEKGYLDIIEWLLKVKPDIDIHINDSYPFIIACEKGHIDIIQYLYKFNRNFNLGKTFSYGFVLACANGYIEIAQWLYLTKPNLIEEGGDECINGFYEYICCEEGNIQVAKWLFNILPPFDITNNNDYIFVKACENKHVDIAEWIQSLKPYRYKLNIEHECIIGFEITKTLPLDGNIIELKNIDMCPICCDDTNIVNLQTNCGHNFCTPCMNLYWMKNHYSTCPYCRTPIKYFSKIVKI